LDLAVSRLLRCDGCGRTLQVPTKPENAELWTRLDRRFEDQTKTLYWCGACPNYETLVKRLEDWTPIFESVRRS
jgi:hypothetical protein